MDFHGLSLFVVFFFFFVVMATPGHASRRCRIKCGVLDIKRGPVSLFGFVKNIWTDNLRFARLPTDVELTFVKLRPRSGKTMDDLIEAYMEIGATNVSAVIGPYLPTVASSTEKLEKPYFSITEVESGNYRPYNLITVFPKPDDLYRIAKDVVKRYELESIAVLYEDAEGGRLVEELVLLPSVHVRSWKLNDAMSAQDIRQSLLSIRLLSITNVVLMVDRTLSNKVIGQALHLSMLTSRYSWIIPSVNRDDSDLRTYAYTQVNLTTFRMVQKNLVQEYEMAAHFTQFEYATVYDSLLTLYNGVHLRMTREDSCQWGARDNLLGTLSQISDNGATGVLSFRDDGSRKGYTVNVLSLGQNGLEQIGYWNSSVAADEHRLHINDTKEPQLPPTLEYPLGKEVVKVVTIVEPPFVRWKADQAARQGNDRFEGYCIDLLDAIAKKLGFQYELYLVHDGQYGSLQADGSWSGMIGELLNGNASLIVGPITINSEREKAIDFSKPYKTLGISMIMKKPSKQTSLFEFLEPLSTIIWFLLLGAFLLVSTTLYIVDRVAPTPDGAVRFDVQDSLWFTFASMLLTGTDKIPRTISGRIISSTLWFFSLIIISSYTANLAAFLTVSRFESPIRSVRDLAEQSKVHYGTVKFSQVSQFFEHSKLYPFQHMWQIMSSLEQFNMVNSSEEGFRKVKESDGDYAFLWDSPVIQHRVTEDCELIEVGQPFDSRGYGIGVPPRASFRDDLTMAILRLGERGVLQTLEDRWWQNSKCPDAAKTTPSNTQSLPMEKVAGVFVVLAAGVVLSLFACVIEYYYRICVKKVKNRNRKPSEKELQKQTNKILCDGHVSSALQADEPFLPNATYGTTCSLRTPSKHTNIF